MQIANDVLNENNRIQNGIIIATMSNMGIGDREGSTLVLPLRDATSASLKAKVSHTQAEKSVMRMTNSSHKCISPMTGSTSRATGYADGEFPRLPPGL